MLDRVCVLQDGTKIGGGTPRDVFYDADLLAEANLTPPTALGIACNLGLHNR